MARAPSASATPRQRQFQLDVYGERRSTPHVALHPRRRRALARRMGVPQRRLPAYVQQRWDEPDEGIWEMRGARRHYVYTKVMAWVAARPRRPPGASPRARRADGGVEANRARQIRQRIDTEGVEREAGAFVQAYGVSALDASALLISRCGLPPPRRPAHVVRPWTRSREISAVEGLVCRYRNTDDGLTGGRGHLRALLVLVGRQPDLHRHRSSAPARASKPSSAAPTTLACLPRRSTPAAARRSATSPRPSATWA